LGDADVLRREGPPGPAQPQEVRILASGEWMDGLEGWKFDALWASRQVDPADEVCDDWTPIPADPEA